MFVDMRPVDPRTSPLLLPQKVNTGYLHFPPTFGDPDQRNAELRTSMTSADSPCCAREMPGFQEA